MPLSLIKVEGRGEDVEQTASKPEGREGLENLSFNGVNGVTGGYLLPEMTVEEISRVAQGEPLDEENLKELKHRHESAEMGAFLGVSEGTDPKNLAETGWGIIFAHADGEEVEKRKEALKELLDLRKEQAGNFYKEFTGPDAVRQHQTVRQFLARHCTSPGQPADPEKVPYYLLIVAGPELVPFRFQYQLDVSYAVGRIHFDTLDEYANYAASVVRAEKGQTRRKKSVTFFGVRNVADRATRLSALNLVGPLADEVAKDKPEWTVETPTGDKLKKDNLKNIFNSADGPAMLFTASHGMGFPNNHPLQVAHQGALLCQDWKGPGNAPSAETDYFSGDDLCDDARLAGLITFHFACYGAGTPQLDDFGHRAGVRLDIAPQPFIANLPQRLLSHPKGGALAAVGHVERAWGYSFMAPGAGAQLGVFQNSLKRLMEGHPIGSAMEYFDDRYAALSAELSQTLDDIDFGAVPDDAEIAALWTSNNDARSYIIIGDPAVRLAV